MNLRSLARRLAGGPLQHNAKTGLSLDFTTVCPMREMGRPCLYCYVEQRRALTALRGFTVPCTKLVVPHLEYDGQVRRVPPAAVADLNAVGGLRVFAFSDYHPRDRAALLRALEDAASVGLRAKVITKSAECLDLLADLALPNVYAHVSTDYEHAGGWTAELAALISNALPLARAAEYARRDPAHFRVRYMAVHPDDAARAAADERVHIVTPYHGYVGPVLREIVHEQTADPSLERMLGPYLGRVLDEWQDMSRMRKTVHATVRGLPGMAAKMCCQTGACATCQLRCAFRPEKEDVCPVISVTARPTTRSTACGCATTARWPISTTPQPSG